MEPIEPSPPRPEPEVRPSQEALKEPGAHSQEQTIEIARRSEHEDQRERKVVQEDLKKAQRTNREPEDKTYLFGDFPELKPNKDGRLPIPEDQREVVGEQIVQHKRKKFFSLPSLLRGSKTATEYDNYASNYSTKTTIASLADGKRVYVVYNYPSSQIHRVIDAWCKKHSGLKTSKADSEDWKEVFESRSNIPIFDFEDPHVILMPYLRNVNAGDLFAHNHQIEDFGPFEWAKKYGLAEKVKMAEKIVDELHAVHQAGRAWGEPVLSNVIIIELKETGGQKPVIVDLEIQYDEGVGLIEQKARDLRDVVFSVCGALNTSEGLTDYAKVIKTLIDRYPDQGVKTVLGEVVRQKLSLGGRLVRGMYEIGRLRMGPKKYAKINAAIDAYLNPPPQEAGEPGGTRTLNQ